jgi:hypothetical protein
VLGWQADELEAGLKQSKQSAEPSTPRLAPPAGVSRPKLAQAAVIAHFLAHPNSEPTSKEIGEPIGIDAETIRNTLAWKAYQKAKGRTADSVGDAGDIGDIDPRLEFISGRQERGTDRRKLRRG